MSLEDKAKEIVNKIASQDAHGYIWDATMGRCPHCEHEPIFIAKLVYKQAIDDLMERAKESPLEFSTIYTGFMDRPDGSRAAFASGETEKRKVIFLTDLEKLAEDLK